MATTVTNTFTAGTKARASQVNTNFTEVVAGINALEATTQYATLVGDSSGVTQEVRTSLIGRIAAEYRANSVTITNATPAVVTHTGHGRGTGDKVYFTTTGGLPTGLSINTAYWLTNTGSNTYTLSSSLALCVAGTMLPTSSDGSGTHTGYLGGLGTYENYQAATSGTLVPTGHIGEFPGASADAGTGGSGYYASSATAITNTGGQILVSLTLQPGIYLVGAHCHAEQTTGAATLTRYLTIGTSLVSPSMASAVAVNTQYEISYQLPIIITAHNTVVSWVGYWELAKTTINSANHIWAVRVA